jgi:hypothetical protein
MSSWIQHRRKGGQSPDNISLVSIRPQAIAFNARFVAEAKLIDATRVSVFLDPGRFRIGFKFQTKATNEDSYSLSRDGGGTGNSRAIQTTSLMREHPWIAAVARIKDPRQRRFKPEWHSGERMWIITLCPAFENRVSHKSEIPGDARGIYRYRKGDEIVYIGRGTIRPRLRAPERNEWDFDVIEYSELESETEQERWETYWLDQFASQHGKLPLYNRIGGKKS